MVNARAIAAYGIGDGRMSEADPERALILTYAPAHGRAALAALLALDDALAQLLRSTSQPAVGQLRLAWWREALARLDTQPPPAEPVLQSLAAAVLPLGVSGTSLVPVPEWSTRLWPQ